MASGKSIVLEVNVRDLILLIRGQRVILDADLARLYGGSTKRLNEQPELQAIPR
jgi:hypothetical protein